MSRTDVTRGALVRVDLYQENRAVIGIAAGVVQGDGLTVVAVDTGVPPVEVLHLTDEDSVAVLNPKGWRQERIEYEPDAVQ
jgi:hypothetical protein